MARKLADKLSHPLTMAKFLNADDLHARAMAERADAAAALQSIDQDLVLLESEVRMAGAPGECEHITGILQIIERMKAATNAPQED